MARPDHGVFADFAARRRPAHLAIRTSTGADYFLKLEDAVTGQAEMMIYLRGGNDINVRMPVGAFKIKYATGNRWCSDIDLFGPSTRYAKASETFEFGAGDEWTITLIPQIGGNLETQAITRSEF